MGPKPYRFWLLAAATYNLLFFAWTAAFPASFFHWVGLGGADQFQFLWRCIGLLIGCYGIGYYLAARYPREGRVAVVVGLLGKILVPFAWTATFLIETIPARTFVVVLVTDIIWWPAFLALTLAASERWRLWDRLVFWISLAANVIAFLFLARTATKPDLSMFPWVVPGWVAFSIAATFSIPLVSLLLSRYSRAFRGSDPRMLRIGILLAVIAYLVGSAFNFIYQTARSPDSNLGYDRDRVPGEPLAIGNTLALVVHGTVVGILLRARGLVPTLSRLCLLMWLPTVVLSLLTVGLYSPCIMLVSAIPTFLLMLGPCADLAKEGPSSGLQSSG